MKTASARRGLRLGRFLAVCHSCCNTKSADCLCRSALDRMVASFLRLEGLPVVNKVGALVPFVLLYSLIKSLVLCSSFHRIPTKRCIQMDESQILNGRLHPFRLRTLSVPQCMYSMMDLMPTGLALRQGWPILRDNVGNTNWIKAGARGRSGVVSCCRVYRMVSVFHLA